MAFPEPLPERDTVPRCTYCGAVIGVYEPMTQVLGNVAWTTSRAAEPSLSGRSPGALYHAVCYELAVRGEDPDSSPDT